MTELDSVADAGLDIEVFSLLGAYMNPLQSGNFLRSVIPKGKFYQNLYGIALQCDKDDIHPEIIDWCDVWLTTHNSALPGQKVHQRWLANNFKKFKEKHKRVVWRSIGQSTPEIEKELKGFRDQGMQILRYSPLEEKIPYYAGHDAMIRFSESSEEFTDWNGEKQQIVTIAQSFKKRGDHLGFHIFDKVTSGFQRKVFGTENADLLELNGGSPSYEELKKELRDNRVFFYFGTKPVPYTLSLIEAMLTGIPVVAVGPKLREDNQSPYKWPNYEIPDIISNGINGFWSDNIDELKGYIQLLIDDREKARTIGEAGRQTAIKLFERRQRMEEWKDFLRRG